jgi:hypothetical protein
VKAKDNKGQRQDHLIPGREVQNAGHMPRRTMDVGDMNG